jgi:hypothetical protein
VVFRQQSTNAAARRKRIDLDGRILGERDTESTSDLLGCKFGLGRYSMFIGLITNPRMPSYHFTTTDPSLGALRSLSNFARG